MESKNNVITIALLVIIGILCIVNLFWNKESDSLNKAINTINIMQKDLEGIKGSVSSANGSITAILDSLKKTNSALSILEKDREKIEEDMAQLLNKHKKTLEGLIVEIKKNQEKNRVLRTEAEAYK